VIQFSISVVFPQVVELDQLEAFSTELLRSAITRVLEGRQGFPELILGLIHAPKVPAKNSHAYKALPLITIQLILARNLEGLNE
jgi:hypothetical protein